MAAADYDVVTFDAAYVHETELAFCLITAPGGEETWFPKRFCSTEVSATKRKRGEIYKFKCAQWLAEREGVV